MDDNLMRIGEIAAFFGVSVKAMRVYERLGVLTPVKVDAQTGYRYYRADQIKQLDAVLELKRLGFTLAEVKILLKNGLSNDSYKTALVRKRKEWQEKIIYAEDKINTINEHITELNDECEKLLSSMINVEEKHGKSVISEAIWL